VLFAQTTALALPVLPSDGAGKQQLPLAGPLLPLLSAGPVRVLLRLAHGGFGVGSPQDVETVATRHDVHHHERRPLGRLLALLAGQPGGGVETNPSARRSGRGERMTLPLSLLGIAVGLALLSCAVGVAAWHIRRRHAQGWLIP